MMKALASNVDYGAIELERLNELQSNITARLQQTKDWGVGDSLRQVVLSSVVSNDYDGAIAQMADYVESKSAFPAYADKVQRYQSHAQDLIRAIQAKRSFSGLGVLPLAKQQEIYEKVLEHFEELKAYLKRMEIIDKELRLEDIRSTTWVLKAVANATFFVVGAGFLLEVVGGLGESFHLVFSEMIGALVESTFKLFS